MKSLQSILEYKSLISSLYIWLFAIFAYLQLSTPIRHFFHNHIQQIVQEVLQSTANVTIYM